MSQDDLKLVPKTWLKKLLRLQFNLFGDHPPPSPQMLGQGVDFFLGRAGGAENTSLFPCRDGKTVTVPFFFAFVVFFTLPFLFFK